MSEERHISRTEYYQILDNARYEGAAHIYSLIEAMTKGGDGDKISLLPGNGKLQEEMYRKYHLTRWKKDLTYRVNPFCPNCGEEHVHYNIQITDEEQRQVEKFYEDNASHSAIYMLLYNEYPMKVRRKFTCPCCNTEFEATVIISRDSYQGRKVGVMRDDDILQSW